LRKNWSKPFQASIKKLLLLIAYQQSLSSGRKTTEIRHFRKILLKNRRRFIAGDFKALFIFVVL